MNKNLSFILFTFICVVCFISSCKNDKSQTESPLTQYEQHLTSEDSLRATEVINTFFQYCEAGKVYDAVAMLYEQNDSDVMAEPELLDNDRIESTVKLLESFPIIRHHIDYIKFSEVYANEAKVTVVLAEATEDMPEVKSVFYFRLYDYLSNWRLCIVNSNTNDGTIVSKEDRDSIQVKYRE